MLRSRAGKNKGKERDKSVALFFSSLWIQDANKKRAPSVASRLLSRFPCFLFQYLELELEINPFFSVRFGFYARLLSFLFFCSVLNRVINYSAHAKVFFSSPQKISLPFLFWGLWEKKRWREQDSVTSARTFFSFSYATLCKKGDLVSLFVVHLLRFSFHSSLVTFNRFPKPDFSLVFQLDAFRRLLLFLSRARLRSFPTACAFQAAAAAGTTAAAATKALFFFFLCVKKKTWGPSGPKKFLIVTSFSVDGGAWGGELWKFVGFTTQVFNPKLGLKGVAPDPRARV